MYLYTRFRYSDKVLSTDVDILSIIFINYIYVDIKCI